MGALLLDLAFIAAMTAAMIFGLNRAHLYLFRKLIRRCSDPLEQIKLRERAAVRATSTTLSMTTVGVGLALVSLIEFVLGWTVPRWAAFGSMLVLVSLILWRYERPRMREIEKS